MKNFLTPALRHPAPQTWRLGPDPRRGKFFFKNPHICVVKMISATRGSFLRYVCWGTRGPIPAAPPPPLSDPPSPSGI